MKTDCFVYRLETTVYIDATNCNVVVELTDVVNKEVFKFEYSAFQYSPAEAVYKARCALYEMWRPNV